MTKRGILSEISSLFDPLGLLGPVIIIPEILLQEIWQLKMHWDESVPSNVHTRWIEFRERLEQLNELSVPRFVGGGGARSTVQIHGFCDASQRAYGACLYIRRRVNGGEFHSELLCSKGRVVLLKTISIPRLELCAALLLAQLWDKVRSSVERGVEEISLWSDSTITLRWISSCSRKWAVFVANRVGEIQRLTSISDWRHISSSENPADLLSLGLNPQEILSSALWWRGPKFLKGDEDSWPQVDARIPEPEMPELRTTIAAVARVNLGPLSEVIDRFSNLEKLCRVMAYCLRFLDLRSHQKKRIR